MNKWLKGALIVVGGFITIVTTSLIYHQKPKAPLNNQPTLLNDDEVKYPLQDYTFTPSLQPTHTESSKDATIKALQHQLEVALKTLNAQKMNIPKEETKEPNNPPIEPQTKPTKKDVSLKQLDLLAARITPFKQSPKNYEENLIFPMDNPKGIDGFTNLKEKDIATNENRLLRTITADKMIPAFLITPISSQIAGKVIAQVESDIFASMGKAVLIPKGSKVIGYYSNNNKMGEYRLDIVWSRIITPHGINIMLTNAKGADIKGYNGLVGELIERNFQRYGVPLLLSTLTNGLLIGITSALNNKGNKEETTNFFGDYLLLQLMRQSGMGINQVVNQILRDKSKIAPIVIIREGSRVFISPNTDIFFPIPRDNEVIAEFLK
ncbi:DNA type IV secretion system protein ComB10 [Helicobacter acinonychis]|uniref:ComB3 protein n=1 Tax=Helicobacter acinonychis (strain Sheeba) TaxID=382638 RepID=Q17ZL0_HELAH|nr:DNA type IV secretion system protein ComB10 [Helicobacter acinonychis]CAJ98916.1 ComB3 protein [Helicobacter acinonychis str. Sheeba]STP04960.1 ComB10 competence protein [Helicobacter acinonychis]